MRVSEYIYFFLSAPIRSWSPSLFDLHTLVPSIRNSQVQCMRRWMRRSLPAAANTIFAWHSNRMHNVITIIVVISTIGINRKQRHLYMRVSHREIPRENRVSESIRWTRYTHDRRVYASRRVSNYFDYLPTIYTNEMTDATSVTECGCGVSAGCRRRTVQSNTDVRGFWAIGIFFIFFLTRIMR